MSKKELERVGTLARLQHGEINNREASEILTLSIRQIKRLKRRYESLGATGLQHHSRGRKRGLHRSAAEVATILELLHAELKDWPPQHASEMLVAEGIKIERQSLRRLMIQHGLWQPRQRKKSQPRMWREPKHHYGELVQLDGSYHCWFDSQYTTLLAYIDDATGCIMALRFVQNEDLAGVVQLTKQYLKQHGRPLKVYTDRGKVFKVNAGQNRGLTQFERMLHDLNIKLKHAYSPQAKGRIERLFGTVQPRLARELELHGITTLAAANKFLPGFIQRFNAQFAISPRKPANFHRPVDGFNLNLIFTRQTQRTLRQDFTISYRNQLWQLQSRNNLPLKPGDRLTVCEAFDQTIQIRAQGISLLCVKIDHKPQKTSKTKLQLANLKSRKPWRPASGHPWRTYPGRKPRG